MTRQQCIGAHGCRVEGTPDLGDVRGPTGTLGRSNSQEIAARSVPGDASRAPVSTGVDPPGGGVPSRTFAPLTR